MFEMSIMGELKFFLGFQIKQLEDGTFLSQTKYTRDILKKFGMDKAKPIKTHMGTNGHLDIDMGGKLVDQKVYCSIIDFCFIFMHLGLISCLVCVCVQGFESHPRNVI
jgi:hypothetical protein